MIPIFKLICKSKSRLTTASPSSLSSMLRPKIDSAVPEQDHQNQINNQEQHQAKKDMQTLEELKAFSLSAKKKPSI